MDGDPRLQSYNVHAAQYFYHLNLLPDSCVFIRCSKGDSTLHVIIDTRDKLEDMYQLNSAESDMGYSAFYPSNNSPIV